MLGKYFKKYGATEETYVKEIIDFYNNEDELNKAEYELIGDKYETDQLCLNLRAGGYKHGMSKETRRKIGETSKGRQSFLGRHHTEDTKQKISDARKGKAAPNKGKHHTEATKQKISDAIKGTKHSEEYKHNMSEILKGRQFTDKHKHNISLATKGKPKSKEQKQKISETHKGTKFVNNGVEEHKAKGDKLQKFLNEGYVYGRIKINK